MEKAEEFETILMTQKSGVLGVFEKSGNILSAIIGNLRISQDPVDPKRVVLIEEKTGDILAKARSHYMVNAIQETLRVTGNE